MNTRRALPACWKIVLLCLCLFRAGTPLVRADDVADARKAFAAYIDYQKHDDERLLKMITSATDVTVTILTGKKQQTMHLTSEQSTQAISKALAKKTGSADDYRDIHYSAVDGGVRVSCNVLQADVKKVEPFDAVLARDASGTMKFKSLHLTIASAD